LWRELRNVKARRILTTGPTQAEARLPRWMAAIAVVGTALLFVVMSARSAGGFALGAALGILSYLWLHQAVDKLLAAAPQHLPVGTAVRFALRYPLALGAVYAFYRTGWLAYEAVLAGLFVPVGGALVEAIIEIRENWQVGEVGQDPTLPDA
jgi:hypothetical protein